MDELTLKVSYLKDISQEIIEVNCDREILVPYTRIKLSGERGFYLLHQLPTKGNKVRKRLTESLHIFDINEIWARRKADSEDSVVRDGYSHMLGIEPRKSGRPSKYGV